MDVGGAPPVQLRAAMQQHFHQPHHAGVVNLNAGDFGFAGHDWQSLALKQREVDVHVEGLRFEAGETIRNGDEFPAQTFQVLQPLVEAQIFHPVDGYFHPQEGAELFVHATHQVLAVDAHDLVAVVEFFQHAMQLATEPFGDTHPEDVDPLSAARRNSPISQDCSKILWMRKCRLKMKLRQYSTWLME